MRYLGEVLTCPSGHAAEAEGFANDQEAPPPDLVDVTVPLNLRRPPSRRSHFGVRWNRCCSRAIVTRSTP